MSTIVEIKDLVKYYGKDENLVRAVDHTSLTIERGKFTAIIGKSGSGKSTLLHLMGGLDRPDSGSVLIDGEDIFQLKKEKLATFRRRKIGFIFQDFNLIPSMNVWENILCHREFRIMEDFGRLARRRNRFVVSFFEREC